MRANCWPEVFGVCFAISAGVIGVLGWPLFSDKSSATWQTIAAGVQAVGSVAAIYMASRIASGQWEQSQALAVQASKQKLQSFAEMLRRIADGQLRTANLLEFPPQKEKISDVANRRLLGLAHIANLIERVPLHDVPYVYVSAPVMSTLSALQSNMHMLERIIDADEEAQLPLIEDVWQTSGAMAIWAAEVFEYAAIYDGTTIPVVEPTHLDAVSERVWDEYCARQRTPVAGEPDLHHGRRVSAPHGAVS